jgi:nucleoside 2-deoxyribosyltransferase
VKVYFGHPCFTDEQKVFKREFLRNLTAHLKRVSGRDSGRTIEIVDPFDSAPNIEEDLDEKTRRSEEIKSICLKLLEECDAMIAVADWNDTGTAFEAGYAHCQNKPVILVSRDNCSAANAMLLGAARAAIDRVLEDAQMKRLAYLLTR